MALQQKFGRRTSNTSAELTYLITDEVSLTAAYAALLAGSPATYSGFLKKDVEAVAIEETDLYMGVVQYGTGGGEVDPVGEIRISGTTQGGSELKQVSLATVAVAGVGATVNDYGGLIGVTEEDVQGVQVPVPVFEFEVTKVFSTSSLPSLTSFFDLTGTTNQAVFAVTDTVTGWGVALLAGEGLFRGATFGRDRGDNATEVVYQFSALPNEAALTVGGVGPVAKKGWEYLWTRTQLVEKTTPVKHVAPEIKQLYVERVHAEGDWTGLSL